MSLSVLVADDEAAIVRVLTRFLERSGHTVHGAATAADALELVEATSFDVVLVDANMPGDGRTVLRAFRGRSDHPERMFLMTGDLAEDVDDLPPGVLHLQKPFDFGVLLERIEGP
ncbi:MAG: response regulator [Gemmatimonadota bacterium]